MGHWRSIDLQLQKRQFALQARAKNRATYTLPVRLNRAKSGFISGFSLLSLYIFRLQIPFVILDLVFALPLESAVPAKPRDNPTAADPG